MAKKSIKSFDEFMKIAVDAAFGEKAEFSREMWEESLKQRYENDEISFRVRDFDNGNIIRDKSVLELFSNMDRLDDYIKYEKDIVNKTAAISTRHVVSAGLDDLLNQFTYSAVNEIYDKLAEEYDISENVAKEYTDNLGKYLPKGEIRDEKTPVSEVRFGQLNASEKSDVYNSIVSTFFDRDAWKDKDGNVIEPSKAAKEALDKVVSFVERMEKDALSGDALSANKGHSDRYLNFIEKSNDFVTVDFRNSSKIISSARAKTALQYASENIKEGSTISDVIADTKLGSILGGLYLNAEFTNDSENVSKVFLEHILNNNHPETPNARLVNADLEKEPKTKEKPEFQSNLVDTGMRLIGRYNVNGVEKVASMKIEFEDLVKNAENARNNLDEFLKPVRTQDMSVLEAYDKLIEQTHSAEKTVEVKSISEEKTAPQKQKMTFAELSQTEKPKLTTKPAPQKKAPEKKLGMNL